MRRKLSVAAIIANGAALVVWGTLALLSACGTSDMRPSTTERVDPPPKDSGTKEQESTKKDGPPPPPPFGKADRKAAEYVLSVGGTVRIGEKDADIKKLADITDLAKLPAEPFHLVYVKLVNNNRVLDEGLANFKGCDDLLHLELDNTPISDKGVANFRGVRSLKYLGLGQTKVTAKGLENFRDCNNLDYLGLWGLDIGDKEAAIFKNCDKLSTGLQLGKTKVTDATLREFKHCKNLQQIDVSGTKVSAAGIAEFKKALPNCKVVKLE